MIRIHQGTIGFLFFFSLFFINAVGASGLPRESGQVPLEPVERRLLGTWRQLDVGEEEAETFEITPGSRRVAVGGRLREIRVILGQAGEQWLESNGGHRLRMPFRFDGDDLIVIVQSWEGPEERRYRRLEERPRILDLQRLEVDSARPHVTRERIVRIQRELEARAEKDQEVRRGPADPDTRKDWAKRMMAVDLDNAIYLKTLISDVGWIDHERFGNSAAHHAFILVQHSGDLALMRAVLPILEERAQKSGRGSSYALLFDRTQLMLGYKQRFGTQLGGSGESLFVSPLEDLENVDTRRAEIGLGSLEEYLDRFRENNKGQEIPIREEF